MHKVQRANYAERTTPSELSHHEGPTLEPKVSQCNAFTRQQWSEAELTMTGHMNTTGLANNDQPESDADHNDESRAGNFENYQPSKGLLPEYDTCMEWYDRYWYEILHTDCIRSRTSTPEAKEIFVRELARVVALAQEQLKARRRMHADMGDVERQWANCQITTIPEWHELLDECEDRYCSRMRIILSLTDELTTRQLVSSGSLLTTLLDHTIEDIRLADSQEQGKNWFTIVSESPDKEQVNIDHTLISAYDDVLPQLPGAGSGSCPGNSCTGPQLHPQEREIYPE
jgi:hypothetical protein